MAWAELTEASVLAAIADADAAPSRKDFLSQYGFKGAKDYFLHHEGENYDSKAIVAVAHKYLAERRALRPDELSGGYADAAGKLQALGFIVSSPGENGDWTWDEHVLALDLYMDNPGKPKKGGAHIVQLSRLLIQLGERRGALRTVKFRNANGVYMKLMNFRRLDPAFQEQGKKGLVRGAKGEIAVWDEFADNVTALRQAAAAIRLAIDDTDVVLTEDPYEADETGVVIRLHKSRERDPKIVRRAKAAALAKHGKLACEVCDFDFSAHYGSMGKGFIEAHHRNHVSKLSKGERTRVADLAMVCANCHRMLHRRNAVLSVEALKDTRVAVQRAQAAE